MLTFFIGFFTFLLILLSFFTVLVVLMQRPSANAGMGAALGGGAAEQAFGGEAGNVLTKTTIYSIIIFLLVSFGLYLGTMAKVAANEREREPVTRQLAVPAQTVAPETMTAPAATESTDVPVFIPGEE
jgi:preprotein translocase subunit SecG